VAGRLSDFTAVANEFGLTQAAASQRIRKLEAYIGHAFIRSTGAMVIRYGPRYQKRKLMQSTP
jgi:DNA-binding transcriptional LysR family regulator